MRVFRPLFAVIALLVGFALPASAQTQCGFATSVSFPVDTTQFQIVQDFGAPSPRHQGRYHTGEDWYGGRSSYGTPVRAIAAGRVTYSAPNGWGRDGGVIIIEHTMPDSTTAYSMYGHITEATGITFPAVYTCVREGDIIAAVGDPRPAPHLHFEIRTNQPDIPGPGYTWEDPVSSGWRRPSKFIDNWQVWFLKSTLWHADIADEAGPIAPPVELPDHSLLVLDAGRVLRVSSDGRVLWRVILDQPAVGLVKSTSYVWIAFASGKTQEIDADGNLAQSWQLDVRFDSSPMHIGGQVLFHTTDNRLISVSEGGDVIGWQLEDIPPIQRWTDNEIMIGIMSTTNEMLTIGTSGVMVDRAVLREPGSLVGVVQDLLAYTRGGLWRIDPNGKWTLELPTANPPPGGRASAVAEDDEQVFLFDGSALHAYDREGSEQWATPLPGVGGTVSLSLYNHNGVVLLTSNHGDIIAVQASSGGVCNATRIYGSSRAREWHSLGDDGVLRVYVADQILGLQWAKFLMACG